MIATMEIDTDKVHGFEVQIWGGMHQGWIPQGRFLVDNYEQGDRGERVTAALDDASSMAKARQNHPTGRHRKFCIHYLPLPN